MHKNWLRIWKEVPLEEIQKSVLVVGDLNAYCGACKEIGLSYKTVKTCPKCQAEFRYVTSKLTSGNAPGRYKEVARITLARPELAFIDYDDYHKLTTRSKAHELFGGGDL